MKILNMLTVCLSVLQEQGEQEVITATNAVPNQAPKPLPFKANVSAEPSLESVEADRSPDETEEITMPPPMQPFDSLVRRYCFINIRSL